MLCTSALLHQLHVLCQVLTVLLRRLRLTIAVAPLMGFLLIGVENIGQPAELGCYCAALCGLHPCALYLPQRPAGIPVRHSVRFECL